MLKKIFFFLSFLISVNAFAGNKIKVYFNHPVNTSVSTGVNASYLSGSSSADTIVAYIDRAKYTLDIAVYDYNQGSFANIATAVNAAYTRGVTVRWIYDGAATNAGLAALNSGIHTLGRPAGGGIMHNKFMAIDANSSNPDDAIVWTGSYNWNSSMISAGYNNMLFLQDQALAQAYTAHFNMMWGSTTAVPNAVAAKFGADKTNLGAHTFHIDGHLVELYFSPSDGTGSHIQSAISSANTDLYFGMYTFTQSTEANMIVSKYNSGVYVSGINDSYSTPYSPFDIFTAGLGSHFKVYSGSGVYHSKMMIVDPSDTCSDPLVLTGSHNWTFSANTENDENTVIIHSDTIANMYYQSFYQDFISLGGSLAAVGGCGTTGVNNIVENSTTIFPNPTANGNISISYQLITPQEVTVDVYNVLGQKVQTTSTTQQNGPHTYDLTIAQPGMYFLQFNIGGEHFVKKVVVAKQ